MKTLLIMAMGCIVALSATAWADELSIDSDDDVRTSPAEQRAADRKSDPIDHHKISMFEQHGAETRARAWHNRGPVHDRNMKVTVPKRIVKISYDATKPMANEQLPIRK